MSTKTKIKTVILEEHNEAFLLWNTAIKKNILNSENNVLLHFDEHLDMSAPRVKTSIFDVHTNYEELINFTYNELSLNSFIVPAVFQGIFDRIYWIKEKHSTNILQRRKRCVRTFNDEGKKFLLFNPNNKPFNTNMVARKFTVTPSTVEQLTVFRHNNLVLDISLNYFSNIHVPSEYKINYIEITENEYNEYKDNFRYHNLKYELMGHRIEAKKENGKFYYVLNDHEEIYSLNGKNKDANVQRMITKLAQGLKRLNVVPRLIHINRSVKSGYTPEDQAKFIESELIKSLGEIYNLEISHIDDWLSEISAKHLLSKPEIVL